MKIKSLELFCGMPTLGSLIVIQPPNDFQESVGLMRNLLRGRDSGPKYPDFSLHSYHYAPQNYVIFSLLPHLLATIILSPTGSWRPIYILNGC